MYSNSESRLEYLSNLEKGWLDGEGQGIPDNIIERTRELLQYLHAHNVQEPILFPMEEGQVILEWHLDNGIVTIDVEPTTYYLFAMDATKNFGEGRYIHIEDVRSIDEVIEFAKDEVGTS